jgi:hypothetical protein
MILASVDVRSFVRGFPPFDAQDEATMARVLEGMQIEFFPAGSDIGQHTGDDPEYAYIVRAGAVELLEDGRLVDAEWMADAGPDEAALTAIAFDCRRVAGPSMWMRSSMPSCEPRRAVPSSSDAWRRRRSP